MRYLPRYSTLNKLGLSLTLCAFTAITVLPTAPLQAIEFNDVAAGIRIGKLAEKGKKYLDKMDGKNLIDVFWDLKEEVEAYSGQYFDLDHCLTEVFKEVRKSGEKISSKHEKELRSMFKKKKIRLDHKKEYRAMCFAANIDYDEVAEMQLFRAKHGHDDKVEIKVPFKMVVGVTGALCGLFLYFVPIPGTGYVATFLMTTGVKYCCDAVIEAVEEREKRE